MIERRTIVDGDVGIILARNQKLQGIEGDRIANPPDVGTQDPAWVFGVNVDNILRPLKFGVYNRGNANQSYGRLSGNFIKNVPARNFVHSFDPDRFDQVRGLSALISAINDLQDSRETLESVKGAIKLENILALIMKLKPTSSQNQNPLGALTDYKVTKADGASETRKEFKVNQGINTMEIDIDEDVLSLEKKNPGNNFNEWMIFQIRLAAMALDMPLEIAFHFYTRGSFSSLKGAIGQYHATVNVRRSRLEDQVITRIAEWVIFGSIKRWIIEEAKGVPIELRAGLEPPVKEIDPRLFGWQWDQLPFLEPNKQIEADTAEYKAAATTLQDISGKRGRDWEDVLEQRSREYMKAVEISERDGTPLETLVPQLSMPGEEKAATEPAKK